MIGTLLFNRYEILEKLGEGGMGVVYKAKCNILNRFVAIKVLKADLSNSDDFIARFKREANSIASLSHPNIVNIYDVVYDGTTNFLVMEYINGKSLNKLIKENGKFSTEAALDIVLQITKALEVAHRNNIIHRDIKPDNILITEDNIVKLMDFGIAKIVGTETITSPDQIIGSVHYLSPEQAKGIDIDCRTDIYSLGIVMYKMFTGKVPFNGKTSVSVVLMHIKNSVTPPKDLIKEFPEAINEIILKTLEKEPNNRFQTAKELYEALIVIKRDLNANINNLVYDSTLAMTSPSGISAFESDLGETEILDQIATTEDVFMNKAMIPENIAINQVAIPENVVKNQVTTPKNVVISKVHKSKSIINNKIILSVSGLIILSIFALVIFLPKGNDSNTTTTIKNTTNTEPNTKESSPPSTATTDNTVTSEKGTEVATGNYDTIVPSVIWQDEDTAKTTITDGGFSVGTITREYNNYIPKGCVIEQSPEEHKYYEENGKVNLVISMGPKNPK